MADHFFALLDDGSIKRITILQSLERAIRPSFIVPGSSLTDGKDEVQFDGNYIIDEDEVLFVSMLLPESFQDVVLNPIQIPVLDLQKDRIKALFWYEAGIYYFQNFDERKMLRHRNVLFFNNQTYDKLSSNAFIVDNKVHAVYKIGQLYFQSYANANKIFSLSDFYEEATNQELIEFGDHVNVSVSDPQWFLESNTVIRKQVRLLQQSALLDDADTKKVRKSAKKFNLEVKLDDSGKIVFPRDRRYCKEILFFLNENYYEGLITKTRYRTNSKRLVPITTPN